MEKEKAFITLGEWLKDARAKRGLSLRKLAELSSVSHTTIDKIERGGGARDDTLTLLAGALAETPQEAATLFQEAKAASAGLSMPTPEISALAVELSQLDVDDQQYILNLIRRLSASRGQQSAEPAPTEQE